MVLARFLERKQVGLVSFSFFSKQKKSCLSISASEFVHVFPLKSSEETMRLIVEAKTLFAAPGFLIDAGSFFLEEATDGPAQ